MSHESLPMSCPGNTRSKSLKPMKYDIYSSTIFKLCYFAPCRRREARGRCKEGNSQCTHPLPACSWCSWASEASSKIGPHPATSPSYSCHNFQITYIAAFCNWHMKTGLELESPVLKGSLWTSLFLAWNDLCRPWCIILWIHSLIRNSSIFSHVDNRPFASNRKTKRKLSVIYTS